MPDDGQSVKNRDFALYIMPNGGHASSGVKKKKRKLKKDMTPAGRAASLLGSISSPAKIAASKRNGKLGGYWKNFK